MNRFCKLTALCIANFTLALPSAYASSNQSQYTMDGPPCDHYAICSIDPPAPAGYTYLAPCYISTIANAMTSPTQIGLVGVCQMAKAAAIAPKPDRHKDLIILYGWYEKLQGAIGGDPDDSWVQGNLKSLNGDWQTMESDKSTYYQDPTSENWIAVQHDLENIVIDTSVIDYNRNY